MTTRTYTHPDVFRVGVTQGWAEAETDPARIDWPARQAAAAIPFQVIGGRPVNPCQTTAVRYGRNEMGWWGETLMADALVTVTASDPLNLAAARWLLMIERGDGYGWAVPGGHVEPGETGTAAAARELAEETSLAVPASMCRAMAPRYVPDPRASDEAWAVTIPVAIDLGCQAVLPAVAGGDDARRATWLPASDYRHLAAVLRSIYRGRVFAAHEAMLREFLAS
jgi:ADP-ribose pyrophosphatase